MTSKKQGRGRPKGSGKFDLAAVELIRDDFKALYDAEVERGDRELGACWEIFLQLGDCYHCSAQTIWNVVHARRYYACFPLKAEHKYVDDLLLPPRAAPHFNKPRATRAREYIVRGAMYALNSLENSDADGEFNKPQQSNEDMVAATTQASNLRGEIGDADGEFNEPQQSNEDQSGQFQFGWYEPSSDSDADGEFNEPQQSNEDDQPDPRLVRYSCNDPHHAQAIAEVQELKSKLARLRQEKTNAAFAAAMDPDSVTAQANERIAQVYEMLAERDAEIEQLKNDGAAKSFFLVLTFDNEHDAINCVRDTMRAQEAITAGVSPDDGKWCVVVKKKADQTRRTPHSA